MAVIAKDGVPVLTEVPDPQVGPGEVLIRVKAAGVNRADVLQAVGKYPPAPGAPQALGLECAGIVEAVGPGVDPSWVGAARVALVEGGAQAELCVARASATIPLPPATNIDPMIAGAALLEAAVTSWHNLVDVGQLQAGQTVVIHGGSGGIGVFAVQLAKVLGAYVVTTAGTDARRAQLAELGLAWVADYRDGQALAACVQEASEGSGADIVFDIAGAGGLETNLQLLGRGGKLIVIGLLKGQRAEIDLGTVLAQNLQVIGTTIRSQNPQVKADLMQSVARGVWPAVEAGLITPVVARTFAVSQVAQAHEWISAREGRPFGKIVLTF